MLSSKLCFGLLWTGDLILISMAYSNLLHSVFVLTNQILYQTRQQFRLDSLITFGEKKLSNFECKQTCTLAAKGLKNWSSTRAHGRVWTVTTTPYSIDSRGVTASLTASKTLPSAPLPPCCQLSEKLTGSSFLSGHKSVQNYTKQSTIMTLYNPESLCGSNYVISSN